MHTPHTRTQQLEWSSTPADALNGLFHKQPNNVLLLQSKYEEQNRQKIEKNKKYFVVVATQMKRKDIKSCMYIMTRVKCGKTIT